MRKATITALLLFAFLSLVFTYPLAIHLADAVEDRQDALLNVWITAWDGHQLLGDPLHLFDANIFYPYPRTLAYSELLLGNALLALPITAASGNPVLGYNLALLSSFVLSGFGTYLLVLQLTRAPSAGLVAGLIFAFSSYRLSNLAQAQLLTTQWMPFALLSLYHLMHRPRRGHVVTFVLFFCLQALSSFYYAILLALAVLGFVLWSWMADPETRSRRTVVHLLLAGCLCAVVILPFALPYFQVQRDLGFERTLADNEPFSASLRQYVMVPPHSAIHRLWLPSDDTPAAGGYPVDALFPGLVAVALASWGLVRGQGHIRWFLFLLLLAAFCLSLGPRLYLAPGQPAGLEGALPYAWLYAVVPGFKALRAPVRFDALVSLSLALLAGYGVDVLLGSRTRSAPGRREKPHRLWLVPCSLLLAGLIVVESLVWPAAQAESVPVGDQVPPVYGWLAKQPSSPVLELPLAFTPGGPKLDYQYLSTYHWQPSPDGYSGFIPPKHGQLVYEMARFPSERSVTLLQALDVGYLILHSDRYPASHWAAMQTALAEAEDLTQVEVHGADQVYHVRPRTFDPGTLKMRSYFPARAAAAQPYMAYLIAINTGPRSYAVQPTDALRPAVIWEGTGEGAASLNTGPNGADLPLVTSPDGGAAIVSLPLMAPSGPGTYRLAIGEQDGPLGDWMVDGVVEVGDRGDDSFPVPVRLSAWSVPSKANPGQPLPVDLTWRALGKIDAYYSVYVKLLDASWNTIAGWDGQPRNGQAPTLLWVPGETIADTVTLMVPADAPFGDYTVEVGMYRASDLARGLTLDSDGWPVDRILLGTVRIEP